MTPTEIAKAFAADVIAGKQIMSHKVRLACERFLRELALSAQADYKWRYDEERADRPVIFVERFLRPTKGDYDSLALLPWQIFCTCNMYGWVSKETGYRRFREALITVGRKNGKSTWISGLTAYAGCKDNERGADIYLLANSKEQAGIIYNETRAMIENSPEMQGRFRTLRDGIYHAATFSKIQHRASDSRKLDGLNAHHAIFDEIHEFEDYKLIDAMRRSQGNRKQPMTIYITTMGFILDGPLMNLYKQSKDILEGEADAIVADRFFCFIAELDDPEEVNDPAMWSKANPSLGTLIALEYLKEEWARAQMTPQERGTFITKQFNLFTSAADADFIEYDVLERNTDTIDEEMLRERECRGGFDLSATEDFTSACLFFPLDDGRFFILSHSWVPQAKVDKGNERIEWHEWQMKGYLTICPGDHIDQDMVLEWFVEMSKKYDIVSIGYDPANAPFFVRMLQAKGMICNVVRQGPLTLNGPMKATRELFLEGRIISNNDPMFRWYLRNVRLRKDFYDKQKDNWMPTKANRYRKIDGFMAFLFAHTEYIREAPIEDADREVSIDMFKLERGWR